MAQTRSKSEWYAGAWLLLVRVTVAAALLYCLWRVRYIVATTMAAIMLAYAVLPLAEGLERFPLLKALRAHPRRLLCTTVAFVIVGVLLWWMAVAILRPLVAEIATFFQNLDAHSRELDRRFQDVREVYSRLPDQVKTWLEGMDLTAFASSLGERLRQLLERSIHATMLVVELILIPVLAFYFITEGGKFKKEFAFLVPRQRWRDALYVVRESSAICRSYAMGQIVLALLAGVVVWGLLLALGLRYALALGVVAGVTRAIPVVGPIIGGIPIVLLATLQGWENGLAVLLCFTLMHLIESKLIMPKLIGYRVNLHPAIIIIVLLIGAEFWGMWGMFLAAPAAAIIKVMINRFWVRAPLQGAPERFARLRKQVEVAAGEYPAGVGAGSHSRTD